MSFTARGYGGYHDVVGSADSPTGDLAEDYWTPEKQYEEDGEGYADVDADADSKAYSKQQGDSPRSNVSTTLEQASSILAKVPGAKTVSYANAGLFGGCGLAAALVAWLAGLSLLLVLLARWYLPAHDSRYNLPLHFDYAAGPAAAMVWLPLLKPSALADSLSPPSKPYTPAAAGLRGLLTQTSGNYARGGSSSRTGLGFSPLSRHSKGSSSGDNSTKEGWWARISGRSRRRRRAAARAAAAAASSIMHDVGNGVSVPEGDWLVPMKGETSLTVDLEMPAQSDMVQVTGELFTTHGISLGRWTSTWVPKPKPLLFRLIGSMLLGPWRALGLVDDTTRVELNLFDAFQNPSAPVGGWGSLPGYRRFVQRQQQMLQSWDEYGSDDAAAAADVKLSQRQGFGSEEEDEGLGHVPGPRALWLRVSLSGRSYEAGPPRVYNARAKLDVDRGLFDRMLASMRPSLVTALLVLTVGGAFMFGGAGTAAVLLYVAYVMYRWGSRIGAQADDAEAYQQDAGDETPWNVDEFVEQEQYATPNHMAGQALVDEYEDGYLPEEGHLQDEDYTYTPISEEEGEEGFSTSPDSNLKTDSNLQGSTSESDEVYQEPDFYAVDEMYSSPRALDGDRTRSPFGGTYGSDRLSFDAMARQGSGTRQTEFAAAPAAPAAVGGAAAVAPATPLTGLGGSRLWSVLGGGGPTVPPQQQQQQQQQRDKGHTWGHGGSEDLPASLSQGDSQDNSTGTAATDSGAAAPTAAAAAAAAVGATGVGDGSDGGANAKGAAGGVTGVAAAVKRELQHQEGDGAVYEGASGQAEKSGGSADSHDWRRQLMEESDDKTSQQQQQQMLKQPATGDKPLLQQQQQQQAVLLEEESAAAPVQRRFGFRFKS